MEQKGKAITMNENSQEIKPCILVQYRGGGYDGCFWEWNYGLVDSQEKPTVFQDVISTGRNGIKTLKGIQEEIEATKTIYFYDLSKEGGWAEFDRESNPAHVLGIAQWLQLNREDLYRSPKCDKCGEPLGEDMCLGGYHDEGGCVISPGVKTCEECDIKDAWDSWVRDIVATELKGRDEYYDTLSTGDLNKVLWEAIGYVSASWEGEGDDRHLYGWENIVDYLEGNRTFVQEVLAETEQLELV